MKKLLTIGLTAAALIALAGCSNSQPTPEEAVAPATAEVVAPATPEVTAPAVAPEATSGAEAIAPVAPVAPEAVTGK